jgi:acetyl-CoA C-acetyltransferase
VAAVPELDGVPSTRHEAACASGSTAVLAACADLEAGRYDLALVVGVELMRNTDGQRAAEHLGSAAWAGHEAVAAKFPWPALFAEVADAYDARYGLDPGCLGQFASHAFDRATRNPLAQARDWRFPDGAFGADDELNPVIEGRLRKQDCGRITDGAAAVLLASPSFAERLGGDFPRIAGFGHRTAHIGLADKIASEGEYLFPHLRGAVVDAYRRADVPGPDTLDVVELHDCFTITGLVALEHLGAAPPGGGGRFITDGGLDTAGINPSGGLIGLGHPVGATGVRMLHDVARQVTGTAGEAQVEGARTALTLNVGGSFTTVVTMIVTKDAA